MRPLLILPLLLLCTAVSAAEFKVLRPQQNCVSFVSKQTGIPVDDEFKGFPAGIFPDPAKPEKNQVGTAGSTQEAPTASFVSTAVNHWDSGAMRHLAN